MRKSSLAIILSTALTANFMFASPSFAQQIKDEAQILYEEAMSMQKKGNKPKAIELFEKALRIDRAVLALDDNGLIDALKKSTEDKLSKDANNLKLLETMGFIYAVCYSDNASAIKYYQQVVDKVEDPNVKTKTTALIERLQATLDATPSSGVSASSRDERLKSWSQMEKGDRLAEEQSIRENRANQLEKAYQDREELENRVPQLQDELKELQESYDKANRLWYATNDELYERRRRRLKREIAEKQQEFETAKSALSRAEAIASKLEAEDEADNNRSYNEENGESEESGGGYDGEDENIDSEGDEGSNEDSSDDNGEGEEGEEEEETSYPGDGDSSGDDNSDKLTDLIDSL